MLGLRSHTRRTFALTQSGFTLTEAMIGVVVGIIVTMGTAGMINFAYTEHNKVARKTEAYDIAERLRSQIQITERCSEILRPLPFTVVNHTDPGGATYRRAAISFDVGGEIIAPGTRIGTNQVIRNIWLNEVVEINRMMTGSVFAGDILIEYGNPNQPTDIKVQHVGSANIVRDLDGTVGGCYEQSTLLRQDFCRDAGGTWEASIGKCHIYPTNCNPGDVLTYNASRQMQCIRFEQMVGQICPSGMAMRINSSGNGFSCATIPRGDQNLR